MNVLKKKWAIPAAALVLTLSIAGGAYAATSGSSTVTTGATGTTVAGQNQGNADGRGFGQQRSDETCGNGSGMGRGHMDGAGSDETALTGDTLTQVTNAALAAAGTGSTLMNATMDDDGIAKYEAHVKKADGTCVKIYLDESFKVVKTETAPQGDRGGEGMGRGRMGGGQGRCQNGTAGTTGTTGTAGTTGTTAAPSTSTTGSI